MPNVANDGTLIRGSIVLTIGGVGYVLKDYNRDRGKPRSAMEYDQAGKPLASSHAEDFEHITGTIMARTDQVAPPKFTVFSYSGKNWWIIERVETGTTEALQQYAVTILENISGASVIT